MDMFVLIALLLIFILLGILFLLPTEKRPVFGGQPRVEAPEEHKDWQAASLKLEKHILTLRHDIDDLKKKEKHLERDLAIEKDKNAKLQEKLSQERGWQKKETDDIDKKNREIIQLQTDLKKSEQGLEREHAQRLTLEREMREAKEAMTAANELKNSLEIQIAKLQAWADNYRGEISQLKEQNSKLSKETDEATFVVKSEYSRIEKLLKDTQKEFADFKAKINKEIN